MPKEAMGFLSILRKRFPTPLRAGFLQTGHMNKDYVALCLQYGRRVASSGDGDKGRCHGNEILVRTTVSEDSNLRH
jgi:hypothetical protein